VVKQDNSVKLAGAFSADALRVLREVPGLAVVSVPAERDLGLDAVLEFAGSAARVAVQVKSRVSAAAAWQVVRGAGALPVLVVAGETTADAREILRQHGVGVVDGLGNVHVELPGLLIHQAGGRPRQEARPARLDGKAGVCALALLAGPGRGWQVRELAEAAGVSAGLAHRVLTRLEAEGVVAAEGTGRYRVRRVADPGALLDLWAEENRYRPVRTRAYLLAQGHRRLVTELGSGLERGGFGYAVTGAAAASLVAPFVTAVPVTEVWVTATAAAGDMIAAAGAAAVADGHNVVFLQARDDTPLAFREQAAGVWVASRFRLYADLRRDPRRGREQADRLRQEVIGF
jgi:hypothetical protein